MDRNSSNIANSWVSAVTLHCCCWLSLAKADQTPPSPHTHKNPEIGHHTLAPQPHTHLSRVASSQSPTATNMADSCTHFAHQESRVRIKLKTSLPSSHPPPPPPPSISHTISLIHYSQLCHAVGRHTHYYYWVLIFFHSFLRFSAHFQGCGEAKRRAPTHADRAVLAQSWAGGGVLTDEARNTNVAMMMRITGSRKKSTQELAPPLDPLGVEVYLPCLDPLPV